MSFLYYILTKVIPISGLSGGDHVRVLDELLLYKVVYQESFKLRPKSDKVVFAEQQDDSGGKVDHVDNLQADSEQGMVSMVAQGCHTDFPFFNELIEHADFGVSPIRTFVCCNATASEKKVHLYIFLMIVYQS